MSHERVEGGTPLSTAAASYEVQTVLGTRTAGPAGGVLVGESIVRAQPGHRYWPLAADEVEAIVAAASVRLSAARELGVDVVVDTSAIETGRDVGLCALVSEATGVAIVVSTGLCAAAEGVSAAFADLDVVELADVYVGELTERIPGTEVRAGAITVAAAGHISELDARFALAAAFAHAETGAPVLVRGVGEPLLASLDLLTGRGVEPERIVACDLDAAGAGWATIAAVARRGVRLGVSHAGDEPLDSQARAATLAYLCGRYGATRVCIGSGAAAWTRQLPIHQGSLDGCGPPRLRALYDAVSALGVTPQTFAEALGAPHTLFAPLTELIDG